MNKIITISREMGSGGRELGKRLAETLNIAYYDREIITAIAKKSGLAESYVESISEKGVRSYYPITYGRSFSYTYNNHLFKEQTLVMVEQRKIIKELAEKSDCVIVGRSAEIILAEYEPLSIFVYADIEHRIDRCLEYKAADENMKREEIRKNILRIDKERKRACESVSPYKWGDKNAYKLLINTCGLNIKSLIPTVLEYRRSYFLED